MADTQQGVRHQSARDTAGTVDTYNGDLRALFNAVATVPAGSTFNEAFMLWLQSVTGSSSDNINDLAALFASQQDDTYNWSSVGELGLPTLFDWEPETAEALPGTSTFTRASTPQVLTTTDGTTFWYQEAKSGELRLDGLRRVENLATLGDGTDYNQLLTGVTRSGNEYTFPGVSNAEIADITGLPILEGETVGHLITARVTSGTATLTLGVTSIGQIDINLTTTDQPFYFSGATTAAGALPRIRNNGTGGPYSTTLVISEISVTKDNVTDKPPPWVDPTIEYGNIGVVGVQYFNTTNGNSVDGSGVVTEATGTTITGGGYLPEPAATFQVTQSLDLSDASWTKDGVTESDQGVTDIGLQTWRIDAGTGTSAHRVFKTYSGTGDASLRVRAKAGTGQFLVLRAGLAAQTASVFDLTNGTITQTGGSTSATTIEDMGGGWYECTVAKTAALAQQSYALFAISDTGTPASDSPSFTGSNETIDLAIPAGEDTLFSTTSEPTAGSTISRVADVLSDQVIPTEFGALFDFTAPDVVGTGNTISLLGAATSAVDIIRLDASFNVVMDDGGTPTTIGTVAAGQRFKVSYGRDATGRSGSLDGATAVTGDAPSAAHEGENFQLYSTASVNQARGIGHLSNIYDGRPSDSTLEGLSS